MHLYARLFSRGNENPTLSTLSEVAAALGMRISLEPLPEKEREEIATVLSLRRFQPLIAPTSV